MISPAGAISDHDLRGMAGYASDRPDPILGITPESCTTSGPGLTSWTSQRTPDAIGMQPFRESIPRRFVGAQRMSKESISGTKALLIRMLWSSRDDDFVSGSLRCQQELPVTETSDPGVAGRMAFVTMEEKSEPLVNTLVEQQAHQGRASNSTLASSSAGWPTPGSPSGTALEKIARGAFLRPPGNRRAVCTGTRVPRKTGLFRA